jgi:hypothetical protein
MSWWTMFWQSKNITNMLLMFEWLASLSSDVKGTACATQRSGVWYQGQLKNKYDMYFRIFHFVAAPSVGVKMGVEKQECVWPFIVTLALYFISSLHVIPSCSLIRFLSSSFPWRSPSRRFRNWQNQYMASGLPRYCISWESLHWFKCFFLMQRT